MLENDFAPALPYAGVLQGMDATPRHHNIQELNVLMSNVKLSKRRQFTDVKCFVLYLINLRTLRVRATVVSILC